MPAQRCTLTLPILLFPYVPYGLYRAYVPVQRCTLPLPIPLFPLCAVRPVKNLSACTTVHFTFTYTSIPPMCCTACTEPQCLYNGALYLSLHLYSPDVPYSLYRASVPVQRCTLPLPIPLITLFAVRPVQSFSVCTTVHFTFTYSSTPPMCRTACTEPQCPYSGALYLYLYIYSPYVPYGLYRASVPVQRCTLPLPIPLLTPCAVRPVQSLSACTEVHFTYFFTQKRTKWRVFTAGTSTVRYIDVNLWSRRNDFIIFSNTSQHERIGYFCKRTVLSCLKTCVPIICFFFNTRIYIRLRVLSSWSPRVNMQNIYLPGVWGLSSTYLCPGGNWNVWGTKSSESRIKSWVGLKAAISLLLGKGSWVLLRVFRNKRWQSLLCLRLYSTVPTLVYNFT